MEINIFIYLILLVSLKSAYSAKIICLGLPMFSHIRNMAFIGDLLIERGHEVWLTTTPKLAKQLRLKERRMKTTTFSEPDVVQSVIDQVITVPLNTYLTTGTHELAFETIRVIQTTILSDKDFLAQIEKENFDLMILDNTPLAAMLSLVPYKFNIPFILCGAYYDPMTWRIPFSPAATPHVVLYVTDKMNLWERIEATAWFVLMAAYSPFSTYRPSDVYVPEKPYISISDALGRAELSFFEYNIMLHYPLPTIPNVIPLGDVTPASNLKIPDNIEKFLQSSKDGVILVSFGSLATTGNSPVFSKLASVFKKTSYQYIIKGNFTESDDQILAVDWIPQSQLLKHSQIKLFITHCGANGIREAILAGVPMLGFPLFAEQPGNAFRIQARGFGIKMDLFWDSEEDIIKTIKELITNTSYKNTVKKASAFMNAIKSNATQEAVFWIEHILEFGGGYLRSAGQDMPFYKFVMLDIVALFTVILTVLFYTCYRLGRCACKKIRSKSKRKEE